MDVGGIGVIVKGYRGFKFPGEYRSRLIADVVTGKLDVREAAAKLPEVEEELGM